MLPGILPVDAAQSMTKLFGERVSFLELIDSAGDPFDIMDHISEGRWAQREDIRRKWKRFDGSRELAWGDGTDVTEVLSQNDIGPGLMECLLIQTIQRTSRCDQFLDSLIDRDACDPVSLNEWFNHHRNLANRRREIALMADADKMVGQAEGCDYFCCAGDK